MKTKVLLICMLMIAILLVSVGSFMLTQEKDAATTEQRTQLVMRDIGHDLLLRAGDDTSRILPVKKISNRGYQLAFQHSFTFMPDTLVRVVQHHLEAAHLPLQYLVTVQNCENDEIVYGYEIATDINNIVPCLGREQPMGCYTINILLSKSPFLALFSDNTFTLTGSIMASLLLFMGLVFTQRKKIPQPSDTKQTEVFTIGNYTFKPWQQLLQLKHDQKTIELTSKEANLLKLFAHHPNQLLMRDWLLKEVWENEGVFVGRSLDVFVSKLRQKLQDDPHVRIVNVHGKGYKLEVS
jgi:DNA-binding winged helix-turn-helix (wHTH) protein